MCICRDGEVDDRLEELFERLLEYEIDDQDVRFSAACIHAMSLM